MVSFLVKLMNWSWDKGHKHDCLCCCVSHVELLWPSFDLFKVSYTNC